MKITFVIVIEGATDHESCSGIHKKQSFIRARFLLPLDSFQGKLVSFDFYCVQLFNQFTAVAIKLDCRPFVDSMVSYRK